MRRVIRRSRTRKTTGITNTRQISTIGTSSQRTLAVGEIRSRSCEATPPRGGPAIADGLPALGDQLLTSQRLSSPTRIGTRLIENTVGLSSAAFVG